MGNTKRDMHYIDFTLNWLKSYPTCISNKRFCHFWLIRVCLVSFIWTIISLRIWPLGPNSLGGKHFIGRIITVRVNAKMKESTDCPAQAKNVSTSANKWSFRLVERLVMCLISVKLFGFKKTKNKAKSLGYCLDPELIWREKYSESLRHIHVLTLTWSWYSLL